MKRALTVALVLLAARDAAAVVNVSKVLVAPAPSIGGRISYSLTMNRFTTTPGQNGLHLLDTTPMGHSILSLASGPINVDCTQAMSGVSLGGATASCGPASDVDLAFADNMPDTVDRSAIKRLLDLADLERLEPGKTLTNEGEAVPQLVYIADQ